MLIKECIEVNEGYRCVIMQNDYSNSLEKINKLVALARADFPHLTDKQIEVATYGGERRKYMIGVEFFVPAYLKAPDYSYQQVADLEPRFS